ncbi:MAG: hypothetical protein HY901_33465 [Deltaproteobacteria bacterium]|nr:hypothetical protein [Deltaproteobacteria bacterium]
MLHIILVASALVSCGMAHAALDVLSSSAPHLEEPVTTHRLRAWRQRAAPLVAAPRLTELVRESFDDTDFASRGWYDNTSVETVYDAERGDSVFQASWTEHLQCVPRGGGGMRLQIAGAKQLSVDFYLKYSANWVGDGPQARVSHHIIELLTDQDSSSLDRYHNLANNHLTTYIEGRTNDVVVGIQDASDIDEGNIDVDLTRTLNGACAGCNGDYGNPGDNGSVPYPPQVCFEADGVHLNGRLWASSTAPVTNGVWHHMRYSIAMNTVSADRVNEDGRLAVYVDDMTVPVLSHNNVVFTKVDTAWSQVIVGPYLSNGNPLSAAQTLWIDDLVVAAGFADASPGKVSLLQPVDGATDVPIDTNIRFRVVAEGLVDLATLALLEDGRKHCLAGQLCSGGTADLVSTGTAADMTITYDPVVSYPYDHLVALAVDASDEEGNALDESYSFTTSAGGLRYGPSGCSCGSAEGNAATALLPGLLFGLRRRRRGGWMRGVA